MEVPSPSFEEVFGLAEGPAAQTGNPMKRLIESFDLVTSLDCR